MLVNLKVTGGSRPYHPIITHFTSDHDYALQSFLSSSLLCTVPEPWCCFVFRDRRDRHRSKSRDGSSRGDKSVTIQTPGEPLLDAESTRGDDRVSPSFSVKL